MKTIRIGVGLICLALVSFAQTPKPIPEREYAVILSIIGNNNFVILDKTQNNRFGHFGDVDLANTFDGLMPETIADFNEKNKTASHFERKFPTDRRYTLISETNLKIFFRSNDLEAGWKKFRQKFAKAGGFIEASRIGFSKDGLQAVAFVSFHCGSLCADGSYYFLKQEKDQWKVAKKQTVWVS